MEQHYYVNSVIRRGELYLEIERIRKLLILAEERPLADHKKQTEHIKYLTKMFRALLLAKDARQKVVQNVGEDNSGSTQNSSTSPTDDSGAGICVRYVLQ